MAALFLLQTLRRRAPSQHYRAELGGFFGIDLAQVLPYNLVRTWHVQLAIFFVATSFLAAGIFLAPMIAGREPRGQSMLAFALLGALAVVVVGSLIGEVAGIHGLVRQGSVVRDAGLRVPRPGAVLAGPADRRAWSSGCVILFRGLRGRLRDASSRATCPGSSSGRAGDPGLLRGRAAGQRRRQLHDRRLLAVLGRPPVGGGLPGAVHDRDGRLHLRAAGGGAASGWRCR